MKNFLIFILYIIFGVFFTLATYTAITHGNIQEYGGIYALSTGNVYNRIVNPNNIITYFIISIFACTLATAIFFVQRFQNQE